MKLGLISLLLVTIMSMPTKAADEFVLFNSKTYVKNPLDLRDPFKRNLNKKRKAKTKMENYISGIYSNIPNTLANASIENIKVVGVVIGPERRAMIKIDNGLELESQGGESADSGAVIFVKEGMRLGNDEAEIKAILPGGIVIVEKIKNVYDQDEYLETVILVSEE